MCLLGRGLLVGSLSELVFFVDVFNTIIEAVLLLTFSVLLSASRPIAVLLKWLVATLVFSLSSLSLIDLLDAGQLAELAIADLAVRVVIASTQDCLNIFTAREETVSLQIRDQVRHADGLVAPSDLVKDTDLDKVLAGGKLSF